MSSLQATLIRQLRKIDGLEDRLVPGFNGIVLLYKGREFAHFHNENELDLRLTARVIEAQGLSHPPGSLHHPRRSPRSPWIEVRFGKPGDIAKVVQLVRLAVAAL